MTDILTAETWLYEQLSGDGTLTGLLGAGAPGAGASIFVDSAKTHSTAVVYPVLLLIPSPARAVMGVGATVIFFNEAWLVKAVVKGESYGPAGTIMNRVRTLLHKKSGTVTAGIVVVCVEERTVQFEEVFEGVVYKHLGIHFRIFTQ